MCVSVCVCECVCVCGVCVRAAWSVGVCVKWQNRGTEKWRLILRTCCPPPAAALRTLEAPAAPLGALSARPCGLALGGRSARKSSTPDFDVSGKTAEPKMACNFAHLLSAACGGVPRRLGRLRCPCAPAVCAVPVACAVHTERKKTDNPREGWENGTHNTQEVLL